MDIFSIRLKEERNFKGYSQRSIAKELGIAQSTYKAYELIGEKNGCEPPFEMIRKIAALLDVNLNYLFGLEN